MGQVYFSYIYSVSSNHPDSFQTNVVGLFEIVIIWIDSRFRGMAMMCSAAFGLRIGTDEEFGGGGSLNVI